MDRAILEAQLAAAEAQLVLAPAGSPQWAMLQQQVEVLQNELADEPVVPPIWGPGGGHGGFHGGGGGHRR